jgi:IS4 transposase
MPPSSRARRKDTAFRRRYSPKVDRSTGLVCDQTIVLTGAPTRKDYPAALRRVRCIDPETNKKMALFTNNFELPPLTIAQLYKSRWRIELFFKWIKQHLRIKAFYGRSENAVKTQIRAAIGVYVLVAYQHDCEASRGALSS